MPGADPEEAGMPPRRHRGRRRYEAAPAHLQGEPVTGTQAGWVTREIDERTERAGNAERAGDAERVARPGRSAARSDDASRPGGDPLLPDTPESESAAAWGDGSGAADDAARAAWYRSQRPPHWG